KAPSIISPCRQKIAKFVSICCPIWACPAMIFMMRAAPTVRARSVTVPERHRQSPEREHQSPERERRGSFHLRWLTLRALIAQERLPMQFFLSKKDKSYLLVMDS